LGTTAEMLLVNQHPAVKACIPRSSIFDLYNDIVQPGGVRQGVFIEVWRDTTHSLDKNKLGYIGKAAQLVIKNPKPVSQDKKREQYEAAKKQHEGNFDIFSGIRKIQFRDEPHPDLGRSIDQFSVHHYKDQIERSGTAIYRIGGWYDGALANSAIKGYLSTKNSVKLIIGPWDHGPAQHISPFVKNNRLKFDVQTEMLRFFDYHLKGIENGIMDEAPVTYYAMGKEEWRHTNEWPVKKAVEQTYYLSADNTLTADANQVRKGHTDHRINPEAGTSGGARWNSLTIKYRFEKKIGYPDWTQRSKNYLQFTADPFLQQAEITGHPVVDLYVASDAKDLQLFVYLDSVDEQGNSTYITEGQFRAIHRKVSEEPAPYPMFGPYHTFKAADALDWQPNEVGSLHFELIPTSHLIPKGHRLRVCIGGADIDHFHALDDPGSNPEQLQVHCGHEFPSRVIVPLIFHQS
jgi:putative CocE/NonD family hydrolase